MQIDDDDGDCQHSIGINTKKILLHLYKNVRKRDNEASEMYHMSNSQPNRRLFVV